MLKTVNKISEIFSNLAMPVAIAHANISNLAEKAVGIKTAQMVFPTMIAAYGFLSGNYGLGVGMLSVAYASRYAVGETIEDLNNIASSSKKLDYFGLGGTYLSMASLVTEFVSSSQSLVGNAVDASLLLSGIGVVSGHIYSTTESKINRRSKAESHMNIKPL